MSRSKVKQIVLPLTAAVIWGFAFTAQSKGAAFFEPCTMNACRYFIGALVLSIFLKIAPRFGEAEGTLPEKGRGSAKRLTVKAGVICGLALAIASVLQQKGIEQSTAGKASFITALYVVLVPVGGLLFKQKIKPRIWIGVVTAVLGLYFISIHEGFSIERGDLLLIACALCFACQILCIDRLSPGLSGVRLSRMQFLTAGVICLIPALIKESLTLERLLAGVPMLLYLGVMSTGVAYTLQILSQQDGEAATVSLLLSLESVFGLLGGLLILKERPTAREWFGCALMMVAVVLTQLPDKKKN